MRAAPVGPEALRAAPVGPEAVRAASLPRRNTRPGPGPGRPAVGWGGKGRRLPMEGSSSKDPGSFVYSTAARPPPQSGIDGHRAREERPRLSSCSPAQLVSHRVPLEGDVQRAPPPPGGEWGRSGANGTLRRVGEGGTQENRSGGGQRTGVGRNLGPGPGRGRRHPVAASEKRATEKPAGAIVAAVAASLAPRPKIDR